MASTLRRLWGPCWGQSIWKMETPDTARLQQERSSLLDPLSALALSTLPQQRTPICAHSFCMKGFSHTWIFQTDFILHIQEESIGMIFYAHCHWIPSSFLCSFLSLLNSCKKMHIRRICGELFMGSLFLQPLYPPSIFPVRRGNKDVST